MKRSSRSRERSTSPVLRHAPHLLARRLAKLLARERRHNQQLADVRSRIDATLSRNQITEYKQLAHQIVVTLGLNETADELERVASSLKKRAAIARRRCRAVTAGNRQVIVDKPRADHDTDMNNPPLVRRVIEYYGPSPDDDLGDPEHLDGDNEFDGEDAAEHDHELGDPTPGSRQ